MDDKRIYEWADRTENLLYFGRLEHERVPTLAKAVTEFLSEAIAEYKEDALRWRERNTPEVEDFIEGTKREAVHQTERWGDAHDRDKSAENWYWLVGYLAGKALRSALTGEIEKAKHHTISTAAALLQWHKAISRDTTGCGLGSDTDLNPDPSNTELKR